MSDSQSPPATASCSCGSVQLEATGTPTTSVVCYCDDCQAGARQIEALPNARSIRDSDCGTAYVLYSKDRVLCSKGAELLRGYKLKEKSATNRLVATCCNSLMFMSFSDARHWVNVHRAQFQGGVPPLDMRICTKFSPTKHAIPKDVPSYPGYPLRFMGKLIAAWIPMLLRR